LLCGTLEILRWLSTTLSMCSSAATRHQSLLQRLLHLRLRHLHLSLLHLRHLLLHHLYLHRFLLLNLKATTPTVTVVTGPTTAAHAVVNAPKVQKLSAGVVSLKENALSAQGTGAPVILRHLSLLQHQLHRLQHLHRLHPHRFLLLNLKATMLTATVVTGPTTAALVVVNAPKNRGLSAGALNRKIGAAPSAQDIGVMVAILVASVATFAINKIANTWYQYDARQRRYGPDFIAEEESSLPQHQAIDQLSLDFMFHVRAQ